MKLWRRLPLLVLLVGGLFLWRSPLFPQEHHLAFRLPADPAVRQVEAQLWRGQTLVRRESRSFEGIPVGRWDWTLSLREGTYRAELFTWYRGAPEPAHLTRSVQLGSAGWLPAKAAEEASSAEVTLELPAR